MGCVVCGGEFNPPSRKFKTCSTECRFRRRNEVRASAARKRRIANRDEINRYARQRRKNNIDKARSQARAWWECNRDHAIGLARLRRAKRRDRINFLQREARKRNPKRYQEYEMRKREKIAAALTLVRELQIRGLEAIL